MFNGNKVIDTDGHVMEPNDLYDRYLEEKFKPDLEDLKREAAGRISFITPLRAKLKRIAASRGRCAVALEIGLK